MQMLSNLAFSPRGIFTAPGPLLLERSLNLVLWDISARCATAWFPRSDTVQGD